MSQHCRANPCCGDVPCSGIPLPQHTSGLPSHNKSIRAAVVSGPTLLPMTAERAIYFLERFKRDEKLLGPNEQLALDFAINALAAAPQPNPSTVDAEGLIERGQAFANQVRRITHLLHGQAYSTTVSELNAFDAALAAQGEKP